MLEKMFDYSPEEVIHILSLEMTDLIKNDTFTEEDHDQAIEAAFVLVALEFSEKALTEEEMVEAVDKVKLYIQSNGMKEN